MISLAFLCCTLVVSSTTAESTPLLEFLAATQKQTVQSYEKLSYEGNVSSTSFVKDLGKAVDFSSHYSVLRQSETILLTRELYTTILVDENPPGGGPPTHTLSTVPSVKRVLKTPEYIVVWAELGDPVAMVYFAEDWQENIPIYENNFDFSYRPVSIMTRCFGLSNPFFQLYEKENSRAKWQIVAFEENKAISIQRELPDAEGNYKRNLDLSFTPDDGLVTQGRFQAPRDPVAQSVEVTYTTLPFNGKEIRVPKLHRFNKTGDRPESEAVIKITYSNFADNSEKAPLTLADMGVPIRTGLQRVYSDGRVIEKLWDGNPLTPKTWRN